MCRYHDTDVDVGVWLKRKAVVKQSVLVQMFMVAELGLLLLEHLLLARGINSNGSKHWGF